MAHPRSYSRETASQTARVAPAVVEVLLPVFGFFAAPPGTSGRIEFSALTRSDRDDALVRRRIRVAECVTFRNVVPGRHCLCTLVIDQERRRSPPGAPHNGRFDDGLAASTEPRLPPLTGPRAASLERVSLFADLGEDFVASLGLMDSWACSSRLSMKYRMAIRSTWQIAGWRGVGLADCADRVSGILR